MLFACDRQKVEERCLSVSVKSESLFGEIYHTLKVDGENERYRGEVGGKLGGDGAECRERHNCVYRGAYFTRVLCRGRERILRNGRLPSNGVVVDYCTYTERCKYVHIHKRMCMCMCMYVCVCVCMVMCMCVYVYVYVCVWLCLYWYTQALQEGAKGHRGALLCGAETPRLGRAARVPNGE